MKKVYSIRTNFYLIIKSIQFDSFKELILFSFLILFVIGITREVYIFLFSHGVINWPQQTLVLKEKRKREKKLINLFKKSLSLVQFQGCKNNIRIKLPQYNAPSIIDHVLQINNSLDTEQISIWRTLQGSGVHGLPNLKKRKNCLLSNEISYPLHTNPISRDRVVHRCSHYSNDNLI